jgi:hypothetical protein
MGGRGKRGLGLYLNFFFRSFGVFRRFFSRNVKFFSRNRGPTLP